MKYFRRFSIMLPFAAIMFSTVILSSCKKIEDELWERPDDLSSYIPDISIIFTGNWSITGDLATFDLKPDAFADFDYWQLKIKSIDYYIDETFIKHENKEPYKFAYTIPKLSQGAHRLIAKVVIEDLANHREYVIYPTKEFEVMPFSQSDSSKGFICNVGWSKSGNTINISINNISILSSLVNSGWVLKSVSIYFDNELINTISKEPFNLNYTARNVNNGEHHVIITGDIFNSINNQETALVKKVEIDIP